MEWYQQLTKWTDEGLRVILVTVIDRAGSAPRAPGAKMIVGESGILSGTVGGGRFELEAIAEAQRLFSAARPAAFLKKYALGPAMGQCCGGTVEVLFEAVGFRPRLWIFGAGHIGAALTQVMQGSQFEVRLVDERTDWIERISGAPVGTVKLNQSPLDVLAEVAPRWDTAWDFAVVTTHSHDLDLELIEKLLKVSRGSGYIGLIGSKSKWERFRQRLAGRGISENLLASVRCPIGSGPHGADLMPHEIAIGIAAQLIAFLHSRNESQ